MSHVEFVRTPRILIIGFRRGFPDVNMWPEMPSSLRRTVQMWRGPSPCGQVTGPHGKLKRSVGLAATSNPAETMHPNGLRFRARTNATHCRNWPPMKKLLILQLRPETDASDDEYASILARCQVEPDQTVRIRVDQDDIPSDLDVTDYSAVIVGGGPGCVSDPPEEKTAQEARIEGQIFGLMPQITERDHPFMGCCYGLGILAQHLGGEVSKQQFGEPVGTSACALTTDAADDPLLTGLEAAFDVFVGHKEAVQAVPPDTVHLIRSEACPVQMIRFGQNVYATQFHPEADAHDFERRIRVYRNHGYFPPEDADRIIAACHASDVTVPGEILRRFAARYC